MGETTHAMARSAVEELERQVERGSMFTQAVLQKSFTRLSLVEAVVGELVDTLTEKGVVSAGELPAAAAAAADADVHDQPQEEDSSRSMKWPSVALRVDPEVAPDTEVVDCDARMHVCHAVCCKLKFALSSDEVEQGVVKWDIGHPYIIRQSSTGYCCHNDAETGGCGVYEDRPGVCRRYSCRRDGRIWTDFDNLVLNQQWIDEHIDGADAFLLVDVSEPPAEQAEAMPPRADMSASFS
jgi:Fe-S-cluster containining protein